jgi:hypothetical protein
MILVCIAIGISLLALRFVVRYVIKALRDPNTYIDKTVSAPILLDGWKLPRK